MKLTMGLIKADIIAAKQAIAYFEENKIRDIKNIAAYHIQHLVMGQTLLKILIKPLADLLFEWVVQVKKCFGHEVPLYYKSYLHKNACFYARYNCR